LHLEDTLVRVPWELMHDGTEFLACRFAVGRMVAAKAETAVASLAPATGAVVVLADAKGDLPHAREEGRVVARLFAQALTPAKDPPTIGGVPRTGPEVRALDAASAPGANASVTAHVVERSGATTRAEFLAAATRARVLHVAGHVTKARGAESGGFVVADGVVTTDELRDAFQGAGSVPLLAFANACHASTSSAWDAASESLAQTLLLAGVRHTLAPMWSVPDADALSFALRFYEAALAGVPFGECVRRARRALMTTHGAPLSFAGYVLYGDPRATLPAEDAGLPMRRTRSGDFALPLGAPLGGAHADAMHVAQTDAPPTIQTSAHRVDTAPTMSPQGSASRPASSSSRAAGIVTLVALVAVIVVAVVARVTSADQPRAPVVAVDAGARDGGAPPTVAASAIVRIDHTGPVRVSVMPFSTTGTTDPALDAMKLGLPEVLVTAFAGTKNVQLIERGQIDVDIKEIDFAQTKYVDPATRAQLGRIVGAEVAVLGAWQLSPGPAGKEPLRFTARFVDVETGEVLAAAKVDGTRADVFGLQDALAEQARATLTQVVARMRP
jgi:TolB-like protein